MIIKQIFNNNIVSTVDDKNQELLILGRGIGFKFKAGDEIDETFTFYVMLKCDIPFDI